MTPFREQARFLATWGGLLCVLAQAAACQSPNHRSLMGTEQLAMAVNEEAEFAVGVVPTMAPPLRVGAVLAFRLSSSADGYGHLYLMATSGEVTRLVENLPLAAGAQTDYPRPDDGIQIQVSAPAGVDRLVLLVTRRPFAGFADNADNQGQLAISPMELTATAEDFLRKLNDATANLPTSEWAVTEARVQVIE